MNKNKTALATAIAALGATSSPADAATISAVLKAAVSHTGNGSNPGDISSSTATWVYDDATGLLTQTGGTFNVRYTIVPGYTLFRHTMTGLVIASGIGSGATVSAASFSCIEGNFGAGVGASICGNYNFGSNTFVLDEYGDYVLNPFANESSTSWGPGTAAARTIGGDDMAIGPMQSVSLYDGLTIVSWVGTTMTLSNAVCNPAAPGNANGCATNGGFNAGFTWRLAALPPAWVPLPLAAWLFGGALVALGGLRRLRR